MKYTVDTHNNNNNMFVYSPSDTEHAVTAKLKRNNEYTT